MDNGEGELAQVKVEADAMFQETMENDIKPDIVKEEPRETVFFIKCEMCNENAPNEAVCAHIKNDRLGDLEHENKLPLSRVYTDTFNQDVESKMDNPEPSSSQKEDSIMKLINAEITVKEEEYYDSPEYLSTDMDLIECEIGQVKTEPIDDRSSLSSDMLAQDEDSNEDVQPGSSKESQKAVAYTKSKKCCLVPGCESSTFLTPNKLFLPLPRDTYERQSWQRAMGKTVFVTPKSCHYCCVDHFKLEEDAENYMQFKMMGNVKLKLKPGVVPSVFACQNVLKHRSKRCLPDVVEEACTSAKKSRKTQAKEVRHQATQTEYHMYMRDVAIQVNLFGEEELKQAQSKTRKAQSKTKKAPKKRTKKIK